MTTEGKIKKVQLQCSVINQLIPKANKYFIDYCKALKEIWKEKINRERDAEILIKFGLIENGRMYKWGSYYNIYWNYEIQELNKRYKQCLK